jgi:hypothetical protein
MAAVQRQSTHQQDGGHGNHDQDYHRPALTFRKCAERPLDTGSHHQALISANVDLNRLI